MKNAAAFFAHIRSSLFGNRLSQKQVDGINAIFRSCQRNGVTDLRHVANILAQVYHETGTIMQPIKETVQAHHRDKNPPDATVIERLDRAFSNGQLHWVKTPYWRDGWFGRGPIMITHRENYKKMGARLGVDLVKNRHLALDPEIGADIAVIGMRDGMFRAGHTLGRYFNRAKDDPDGARRIVNGPDGMAQKIAGYHRKFLAAIEAAGGVVGGHYAPPAPKGRNVGAGVAVGLGAALAAWFSESGPVLVFALIAMGAAGVALWKRDAIRAWIRKRRAAK